MTTAALTWRPRNAYVLCRKIAPEAKSSGGILLPDSYGEWGGVVEVLVTGPGYHDDKTGEYREVAGIEPGAIALVHKIVLQNVCSPPDDEELLFIHEKDILGVAIFPFARSPE